MAENKTKETKASVSSYLKSVKDAGKRKDCESIIELMNDVTGFDAKMWGTSIVGFGSYHYKYASGREGDAPLVGFASRAKAIVLYLGCEAETKEDLLKKLGKSTGGAGCIYIKKLEDVDSGILKKLVKASVQHYKKLYPAK